MTVGKLFPYNKIFAKMVKHPEYARIRFERELGMERSEFYDLYIEIAFDLLDKYPTHAGQILRTIELKMRWLSQDHPNYNKWMEKYNECLQQMGP